jgi:anti-sigma regulatory factor (Ser/Thr protein kinase)
MLLLLMKELWDELEHDAEKGIRNCIVEFIMVLPCQRDRKY